MSFGMVLSSVQLTFFNTLGEDTVMAQNLDDLLEMLRRGTITDNQLKTLIQYLTELENNQNESTSKRVAALLLLATIDAVTVHA